MQRNTQRRAQRHGAMALLILVSVHMASGVWAQGRPGTSTIAGIVLDPDGKAIVDAAVVLRTASGATLAPTTDTAGRFSAVVQPDVYVVEVTAPGFALLRRENIQASPEQTLDLSFRLGLAGFAEAITVDSAGAADRLKKAQDVLGDIHDRQELMDHLLGAAPGDPNAHGDGEIALLRQVIDAEIHQLHSRYLGRREGLLAICQPPAARHALLSPSMLTAGAMALSTGVFAFRRRHAS